MISRRRFRTPGIAAAVAAMLCIGTAMPASAAVESSQTTANAQPAEELEQLDEILVRGKRLARAIEDAENDFFKLYNKLNKNSKFDVTCGVMWVDNSLIMTRTCVPAFIANLVPVSAMSSFPDPVIYEWHTYDSGARRMEQRSTGFVGSARIDGPSAQALAMHYREGYAANVMQVVKSDPRLVQKAGTLAALYQQMKLVQGRLVNVREDK